MEQLANVIGQEKLSKLVNELCAHKIIHALKY